MNGSNKIDILKELKKEAVTYLKANKGKSISKNDITVAENLMVFGYLRGLEEIINKKDPEIKTRKLLI